MGALTARRGFSLKEAAALTGVPEPNIRKAIETGCIAPRARRAGRAPRYAFHSRDLLALFLLHAFPLPLAAKDKRDIWDLFNSRRAAAGAWHLREGDELVADGEVAVSVHLEPLRARLLEHLRVFRAGRRRIASDPAVLSGEPVFEGTRIPLAHIAGLLRRGVSLDEIREDYPALGPEDLAYAEIVARMKPDPGRPRKPLRLVRTAASRARHASAHAAAD